MPKPKLTHLLLAGLILSSALPAEAYIGPGAGAGTITVVLGILASIVMAFFAIIWYPIKRLFFRKKPVRPPVERVADTSADQS